MTNEHLQLSDLGYCDFFASKRKADGLDIARVIAEYKESYRIKNADGEFLAHVTGKFMYNAFSREDYPAVGDWVTAENCGDGQMIIYDILPRKSMLKRKASGKDDIQIIATNIDVAFVIESVDRDFSLNRFERYFAIIADGGIKPAIILNKTDLIDDEKLAEIKRQITERFGQMDFLLTSNVTSEGLDTLKQYMQPTVSYCLLGSSGVGKSTLINSLLGEEAIKTGEISSHSERGKHTTTSREMFVLPSGGIVIDNPGMREVGLTDASGGVDNFFEDIAKLANSCKYADCTHTNEPGCAVLRAIENDQLDPDQYENYLRLKKEARHYEMSNLERKREENQFGKFRKNAKKDLKRRGHKGF